MKKAFTLVEILIVVSILGILAAITIPEFHGHTKKAKESAAKDILQTLRSQIELYAMDHNGTPPGYVNGAIGSRGIFMIQLAYCTDINGNHIISKTPSGNFVYGPYIGDFAENPFNNSITIMDYPDGTDMITKATEDKTNGWLYKAETKEVRLDWPGTDSEGISFYDY